MLSDKTNLFFGEFPLSRSGDTKMPLTSGELPRPIELNEDSVATPNRLGFYGVAKRVFNGSESVRDGHSIDPDRVLLGAISAVQNYQPKDARSLSVSDYAAEVAKRLSGEGIPISAEVLCQAAIRRRNTS